MQYSSIKLDIHTDVLVQPLEKFVTELTSFLRADDLWHAFNPRDEPYAHEVHLGEV